MAYSQVRGTPPRRGAATPLFVPFVRQVLRLPCLLLISRGFLCSLRFFSATGMKRLRRSCGGKAGARKMAVDVSAGPVTIRLSFIPHGNENRGSTLRPQAVLNTQP